MAHELDILVEMLLHDRYQRLGCGGWPKESAHIRKAPVPAHFEAVLARKAARDIEDGGRHIVHAMV